MALTCANVLGGWLGVDGCRGPLTRIVRTFCGPHLVALVRAGATVKNGKLVERAADHGHESGGDDLGGKGRFRLVYT